MKPMAVDDHRHDRDRGDDCAGGSVTLAAVLRDARAELNLEQPPAFGFAPIDTKIGETKAGAAVVGQPFAPGLSTRPVNANPGRAAAPAISGRPRRWATGLVACLGVMLLSVLLLLLMPVALPPMQRGMAPAPTTAPSGFLALVPPAQLAAASRQPSAAWLIAAEMPRDRLAALGLPFDPARAGENVRTELLVNPAGEVLALRLLN